MSTRKIADDLWVVERQSAKKFLYLGMIRKVHAGYTAWFSGQPLGTEKTLEEAEKLFDELP